MFSGKNNNLFSLKHSGKASGVIGRLPLKILIKIELSARRAGAPIFCSPAFYREVSGGAGASR
ncbi:MAG: hypothetical protein PHV59_05940 [Victivallales bacterium]|nr:hypothetical protein [Victivallales bacterium]